MVEAESRATAQAQAEANEVVALAQQATAEAEANFRATAEALAVEERQQAEEQANLARSRELAGAAVNVVTNDPELSILLALRALSTAHTVEAENALHRATLASRVRARYSGHDGYLANAVYSPDETYVASTGVVDKMARLWDVGTGQELFRVPIMGLEKTNPNFNLDGTQLVTLNQGDLVTLSFWEVPAGDQLSTLELPLSTGGLWMYALSPDWSKVAFGYEDGTVSVWDISTGEQLFDLPGHTGSVALTFSQDGDRLATTGFETAKLWDMETGQELVDLNIGENADWTFGFTPDLGMLGSQAQSCCAVEVWDLTDGEREGTPMTTLDGHENYTFDVAFSPDGTEVATASRDQTVRIWNPLTGDEQLVLPQGDIVDSVIYNESGTQLLTTVDSGDILAWDITPQGGSELGVLSAHDQRINGIAFSPDEGRLATSSEDNTAKIWDLATGQAIATLEGHTDFLRNVVFTPDGERVVTASEDNTAVVWDAETGEALVTFAEHADDPGWSGYTGVMAVDVSPDGSHVASAGVDGTARIWDIETGQELHVLSTHTAGLTNVVYSADRRHLATGSNEPDASVKIWDAASGQELISLPPSHFDRTWGVAFSPDGRLLATSGGDTTAKLWLLDYEAGEGHLLATLSSHTNTVLGVVFSPDGNKLATYSPRAETKLWDVSALAEMDMDITNEDIPVPEILSLPGSSSVAFTQDGSTLAVGQTDGTVQFYALDVEELIAIAEGRLTRTFTADECRLYLIEPCPNEE